MKHEGAEFGHAGITQTASKISGTKETAIKQKKKHIKDSRLAILTQPMNKMAAPTATQEQKVFFFVNFTLPLLLSQKSIRTKHFLK